MLEVRPALPSEYDAVGALTAQAYLDDGLVGPDYAAVLRDAGPRAEAATLLVALLDGRLAGTATFALAGTPYAERSEPGEAEIRMLGTAPDARGHGVGTALTRACIAEARGAGCSAVRLSTQPEMVGAHRIYERLGFVRTPDRDWRPIPEVQLLMYALALQFCSLCGEPGNHEDCTAKLVLEPPRYCSQCRRRMVVQVHPTGWSARCSEHGTVTQPDQGDAARP